MASQDTQTVPQKFTLLKKFWWKIKLFVWKIVIFPFVAFIVKYCLRKRIFHEFMLRKEGQQWIDFLNEISDPFEKFLILPDYAKHDKEKIFSHIYKKNVWGSSESRSGPGSTLGETEHIRLLLPSLLKKYEIKTLIDIPCGDWNWMKAVNLAEIGIERYFGGDIVSEIIEDNRKNFGHPGCEFDVVDLTETPLFEKLGGNQSQSDRKGCSLLLCRDCLVHLSYKNIEKFLQNLHRSGIRYLLTTTFTNRTSNYDIMTGDWRPLNFELPPFCFPESLEIIIEKSTERHGQYADKSLGLWEVASLPGSLKIS